MSINPLQYFPLLFYWILMYLKFTCYIYVNYLGFFLFYFYDWENGDFFTHILRLGTEEVESPRVVNVILPEHRGYFVQHLGYFLATFLLLALIVVAVIVLTRRRKKRGIVCVCVYSILSPIVLGFSSSSSDNLFVFYNYKKHIHYGC